MDYKKTNIYLATFINYATDGVNWFDADDNELFPSNELKFHKDWNELLKIVDKLDKIDYISLVISKDQTVIINHNTLNDQEVLSTFCGRYQGRLVNTYQAIVDFLTHDDNYLKLE